MILSSTQRTALVSFALAVPLPGEPHFQHTSTPALCSDECFSTAVKGLAAMSSDEPPSILLELAGGLHAIIDASDYERVKDIRWHPKKDKHTTYVRGYVRGSGYGRGDGKHVSLHQFILNVPKDMEVDHINGNGLDNRRSNMRGVPHALNMLNQKLHADNTSGYRGVSRSRDKWQVRIRINGVQIVRHGFQTKEEAAREYDKLSLLHRGTYARLNFPKEECGGVMPAEHQQRELGGERDDGIQDADPGRFMRCDHGLSNARAHDRRREGATSRGAGDAARGTAVRGDRAGAGRAELCDPNTGDPPHGAGG